MMVWLVMQALTPLPEGYESSAYKVVMWAFVVMIAGILAAFGIFFKSARDDAKAMDTRHNETLKQIGSDFKTAAMQISSDSRAAQERSAQAIEGFAKVMSKQNAIQLAKLPIEMQNEINRIHPNGDH